MSKALYNTLYLSGSTSVVHLLTEGYWMDYGDDIEDLQTFINIGMSPDSLYLCLSPHYDDSQSLASETALKCADNGYGGMAIWAPNSSLNIDQACQYYSAIASAVDNDSVVFN
ncbi:MULTISPECIES: hypothetical protein [Pectobacterium]|nr:MULTISPECIES: hypothetical protein [Pectobacterium]